MIMEMESHIRKVVQEEMEQAKESAIVSLQEKMEQAKERVIVSVLKALELVNPRTSLNHHIETKQGIGYKLLFANKLPSTIYTNTKIESEMGGPIKVELVDTTSKEIVTSGPLSSMKIQTVVLDGTFGFEHQEYWTEQEFNAKVVHRRKDRRPLLIGDLDIALKDGVGIISDLSFTDNSKQTNSGTFRLGARVVQSNDDQVRIKEATSEAFRVKEYRAKVYRKHYPPSLHDDVWRLVHISKDGKYHKRLREENIDKVKDFMQMHKDNPSNLIKILKCSYRSLEEIVQHASTCAVYDDKPNAIDGKNYQPPAKRSCIQKPLVGSRKEQSYENVNNFDPVTESSNFGQSNPLASLQAEPTSNATTAFSGMHVNDHHASASSSYNDGLGDHNHLSQPPEAQNMHLNDIDGQSYQPPACIQKPLVRSRKEQSYKNVNNFYPVDRSSIFGQSNPLTNLQAEPIGNTTTAFSGMHVNDHHASASSSYNDGLGDHNHLSQPPEAQNMHLNAIDGQSYQPPACIQKPLVGSRKEQSYKNVNNFYPVDGSSNFGQSNPLKNLQAEPISNATTAFSGLHTNDHHASASSSYKDELEDLNHLLQPSVSQNMHLTQPCDPMCGNYNDEMDRLLATWNEENDPNLVCSMTSQAPWSHTDGFELPWTSNYSDPNNISSPIPSECDSI